MTLNKFLKSGTMFLEKKGISNAKDDCMQIFLNAFDLTLAKFLQIKDINMTTLDSNIKKWDDKINKFNAMMVKRVKHMPLQYILNEAYFYNLKFYVDENVLIPRQDTEVLVSCVIKDNKNGACNLLDLCTGSGVIGISIAKNININNLVFADINKNALDISKKNVENNNIDNTNVYYLETNMFSNIKKFKEENNIENFDIITINPPYIETSVINELDKEVKDYEPIIALDGGVDGLDYYKIIFDNIKDFLGNNGKVYMEIGFNQGDKLRELFDKYEYKNFNLIKDLASNDRVITFTI